MVHLSAVALLERIDSINQSVRESVYSSRFMTASFVFLNLAKFDCSFNTCIFKENNCFQSNYGPFSPISFQKKNARGCDRAFKKNFVSQSVSSVWVVSVHDLC